MRFKPLSRLRRSLYAQVQNETLDHVMASAVVFAPHQDDETLGCGGTIILKRQAGTPVTCVFMTDGTTSHRQFVNEEDLRRLRKQEALEAAAVLGVASDDVRFLDHPDGELNRHHGAAMLEVIGLLDRYRPEEVFVPFQADRTPDHEATYRIVMEAVHKSGRTLRVCEYPVWFWNQWPWVSLHLRADRATVKIVQQLLASGFGRKVYSEFRSGVLVRDVLHLKREALGKHRSQMTALKPGVAWPTLHDVSDGEFLNCFFQEYEIFRCRDILPAGVAAPLQDRHCGTSASAPQRPQNCA